MRVQLYGKINDDLVLAVACIVCSLCMLYHNTWMLQIIAALLVFKEWFLFSKCCCFVHASVLLLFSD